MAQNTRRNLPLKLGIAAIVIAAFAFVFVRSLKQSAAQPYVLGQSAMTGWRLALSPADGRSVAVLALQVPLNSGRTLFDQIFQRTMQSLSAQDPPIVPLVLTSEFNIALRRVFADSDLLKEAERLGLASAPFAPVCLGVRRAQRGAYPRELYFVLFDAPAFGKFRDEVARLFIERGGERGTFDPLALSPLMPIATTDADVAAWLPLQANREADCRAPIEVQ